VALIGRNAGAADLLAGRDFVLHYATRIFMEIRDVCLLCQTARL